MSPPACTSRLPPPTVVIASRAALAYHVVGNETDSSEMSPPAFTDTLPPTLIRPWAKLAKSIDERLPSPALPTCIHCHQYCEMSPPLLPFVTLPSASSTRWTPSISPLALRFRSPALSGLTRPLTNMEGSFVPLGRSTVTPVPAVVPSAGAPAV